MTCTLSYKTVTKSSIYTVAHKYFAERLSPIHTITQIDLETISMNKPLSDPSNVTITIPTRIQSILTYDFAIDRNSLIPMIQYRSAGQTHKGISAVLDSIPEIGSYTIKIRPFWSDTATSVLSRIGVEVK
jgi:hypothetical protein